MVGFGDGGVLGLARVVMKEARYVVERKLAGAQEHTHLFGIFGDGGHDEQRVGAAAHFFFRLLCDACARASVLGLLLLLLESRSRIAPRPRPTLRGVGATSERLFFRRRLGTGLDIRDGADELPMPD